MERVTEKEKLKNKIIMQLGFLLFSGMEQEKFVEHLVEIFNDFASLQPEGVDDRVIKEIWDKHASPEPGGTINVMYYGDFCKALSSLGSNEPEREGKEEDKTFNIAEEIHRLYKEMPECNLKKHLQKWFELDPSTVPSPPLKPLSEITDEDLEECLCILFGEELEAVKKSDGLDWWKKILKLELTEGGFNLNIKPYFKTVWQVFQFLQHKGYAVPVFYPVSEVKEKGEHD